MGEIVHTVLNVPIREGDHNQKEEDQKQEEEEESGRLGWRSEERQGLTAEQCFSEATCGIEIRAFMRSTDQLHLEQTPIGTSPSNYFKSMTF